MNRRGFFGRMIGAIVAAKGAPDVLATAAIASNVDSDWKSYRSTIALSLNTDRADLLRFYQLAANDPHINQRALVEQIEAMFMSNSTSPTATDNRGNTWTREP